MIHNLRAFVWSTRTERILGFNNCECSRGQLLGVQRNRQRTSVRSKRAAAGISDHINDVGWLVVVVDAGVESRERVQSARRGQPCWRIDREWQRESERERERKLETLCATVICDSPGSRRALRGNWKGVQSISHKSVCTARTLNAATLSSYSFDRKRREEAWEPRTYVLSVIPRSSTINPRVLPSPYSFPIRFFKEHHQWIRRITMVRSSLVHPTLLWPHSLPMNILNLRLYCNIFTLGVIESHATVASKSLKVLRKVLKSFTINSILCEKWL